MRILSTNIGKRLPYPLARDGATGHRKQSVPQIVVADPGPTDVDGTAPISGVVGDHVEDRVFHGGPLKAVLAVGREDLDLWSQRTGLPLPDGWMGENLTTQGWDVNASLVGERWAVGEAVLRVTVPRIPCRIFADIARTDAGQEHWIKDFTEAGGAGTYLAVERGGRICPGDAVEIIDMPEHGVTMRELFWAVTSKPELAARALEARARLDPETISRLEKRLG